MKSMLIFLIVLLTGFFLHAGDNFEIVETWNHGDELVGYVRFSIINDKGNIVASFYKTGSRVVTPKQIIAFAPRGEGPGDLMYNMGLFHFGNDIAVVEFPNKIKIFQNDGDSYKIKDIRWLKRTQYFHMVKDGLYVDDKWFLAGYEMVSVNERSKALTISFLRILDAKGQLLKTLVEKVYAEQQGDHDMNSYLLGDLNNIYLLRENELKVYVVPIKKLTVEKEVNLEVPVFYKKMPADFFAFKKYDKPGESLERDYETWITSYSRITKAATAGNYLLLQIRTCSTPQEKLKKYAMLFYNLENFKLEKTIFIDDYFLGYRDGKYYFVAGGNPNLDDGVENFIIHVYAFKSENEKK